jgi:hypothetical protein
MYPNPATDLLNIQCEYTIKNIVIYDLNARIIQTVQVGNKNITLDLDRYQNGLFLLSLETEKGVFTQKLFIQK